jgi:hypothetical protein
MRPVIAVLGIGIVILGLFGLGVSTWLGWLDIVLGVVALISSGALGRTPRNTAVGTSVGLGVAALICWIIALVSGVVGWLTWSTFAFGVAFVLAAFITRPVMGSSGPSSSA